MVIAVSSLKEAWLCFKLSSYIMPLFSLGVAKEGCHWTSLSPYALTSVDVHCYSLGRWYLTELRGSPLLAVSHTPYAPFGCPKISV